ncbi:MAG: hypothetical protein QOC82_2476 [Frankiaceae bacterium]|jgi:hypothetical protein|nr:hypothetical protein [Frankiaceae bacterium]
MHVNKLTATLVGAAALTAGLGTAASASTATTASNLPIVTVTHDNGGVQVYTGVPGQPLLSASVDNRGICGGFSYEEGFCIPVSVG